MPEPQADRTKEGRKVPESTLDSPLPGSPLSLDRLTWPEVGEILSRDARLLIPVGALEQHGPHLPLGTNTFIADQVACDLSTELAILKAPPFPYGVPLATGPYPGRTGLRRKNLHRAVNELIAEWEDGGVHGFVLITAHRYEPHLDALLMALATDAETSVINLYSIGVGDIVSTPPEGEHAGELETSLMLYLAPKRVRVDRIADRGFDRRMFGKYVRGGVPTPPPGSPGVVGYPSRASAAKGRLIYNRYLETVRASLRREPPPSRTVGSERG